MWQFPDIPIRAFEHPRDWERETLITIFGKTLPKVCGIATLFVESRQIRLSSYGSRQAISLHETEEDFPSDKLLAQVMLVAGA